MTRFPVVTKDKLVDTRPLSDLGAATHGGVHDNVLMLNWFWFASMSNLGREL